MWPGIHYNGYLYFGSRLIREKPFGMHSVELSLVEIYNNEIRDLLAPADAKVVKHDLVKGIDGSVHIPTVTCRWVEFINHIDSVKNGCQILNWNIPYELQLKKVIGLARIIHQVEHKLYYFHLKDWHCLMLCTQKNRVVICMYNLFHPFVNLSSPSLHTQSVSCSSCVDNVKEMVQWVKHGLKIRAHTETEIHSHSSRSHLVTIVTVTTTPGMDKQRQTQPSVSRCVNGQGKGKKWDREAVAGSECL